MPKFSIIVPCYKEIFLKECIESILSQTYQDFELILVNDASPYNIKQIVEQFKDDRIRYYERSKALELEDWYKIGMIAYNMCVESMLSIWEMMINLCPIVCLITLTL